VTGEEVITAAGITRTFLSTRNPLRDSDGRTLGVLGISMDITERRNMENHLRRAQRMESIGTFSGAIAHDFNNLLTIIKGYSQLIRSSAADSQFLTSVEQIDKASDRAVSLTRQLLAFSRQQILQPRVISLNEIISNLQNMLHRLIGEDIEIATHLAPDLWPVKADPGQVEQVLMNLAANARDAMPHWRQTDS
jgi:two-component system cell cycle sensor histidine kinase/response regulator CckA